LAKLFLLIKSHVSGYVKKNGTFVKPHEDKRHPSHVAESAARRIGGEVVGNAIPSDIVGLRGVNLIDRSFASPGELAALAQVFRNPLYETFRVFYERGGKIVGQTGISARLPGTAVLPADIEKTVNEQAAGLKADGVWMLHNHPSGDPSPSEADKLFTARMSVAVPLLKAHVIINSHRYAVIDRSGNHSIGELPYNPFGGGIIDAEDGDTLATYDLENNGEFSRKHGWLLAPMYSDAMRLAITEKYMQGKRDKCVMFSIAGADSQIRAISEYPIEHLADPFVVSQAPGYLPEYVRGRIEGDKRISAMNARIALIHLITQQTGGTNGNILVCDGDKLPSLDWLYDSGAVRDIISMGRDGTWRSYEHEGRSRSGGENKYMSPLQMKSRVVEHFISRHS
jgi:hypothetical protein